MLQRIGLAQALVQEPRLLVLDEPTAGVDPAGSREIRDLILGCKQRGITVLLCSHLLSQVQEICDRIGILHQGRLVREGALDQLISIDTMKPAVARAALEAGAGIVNDVTGLRDPAMREIVRAAGAGAIAMHMQGEPRTMQRAPHYEDVCGEIREFFRQTFAACLRSGLDPMHLAFDPGIGFGKTVEHNLTLLRNLDSMRVSGRPLVLGVSRKSFLGKVLGSDAPGDRAWPTVALTSHGVARGANVVRVHDVQANLEALRMTETILHGVPEA